MSSNKIIAELEAEQMSKEIPAFGPGDTVVVQVKVKEGTRERLQAFEGVVIAKRNRSLNSAFTVRKISHGIGVERTFQTYSPLVDSIEVKRRGDVRQAKLYYLRELSGCCTYQREVVCQIVWQRAGRPASVEKGSHRLPFFMPVRFTVTEITLFQRRCFYGKTG